jgi:5-methylcytosine-specific restriction protein B
MKRDEAQALVDALTAGAADSGLEVLDPKVGPTWQSWMRDKDVVGVIRQQSDVLPLHLVVTNPRLPTLFQLIVYSRPSSAPLMVASKIEGGKLRWSYVPSKHDGRNHERKRRFEQSFGTTDVVLPWPSGPEDVPAFMHTLRRAMEARRLAEDNELGDEPTEPVGGWIFQANPEHYDLAGALQSLPELVWNVRQCADRIKPGDQAFLWLAGKGGGLLAHAEILTAPTSMTSGDEERPFIRSAEVTEAALRVRLRIGQVFDDPPSRDVLRDDPRLIGLSFLRAPQGTNFPVSQKEAAALLDLGAGRQPPRVVKVAPGENARFWDDCREGEYICVGWDELGDLSQYATKAAYRAAFGEKFTYGGAEGAVTKKANELWTFRNLQPGDIVVANRGTRDVLAVGVVQAPGYVLRPEREEYQHTVNVKWDTSKARTIPKQTYWGLVTVADVPTELYRAIMLGQQSRTESERAEQNSDFDALATAMQERGLYFSEEVLSSYLLALQAKRFVILSGISGTGKTRLALSVAEHFGASTVDRREVTQVPEDAFEFSVYPYSLRHNRIVVPVEMLAALRLPDDVASGRTGKIRVAWPEGEGELSLSPYVREGGARAVYILNFSGAFRRWFGDTFAIDDRFYIALEELGEDEPHRLRFGLPEKVVREVETEPSYRVIAVRPDWTDNRGLLGYYNPVLQEYVATDFLRLLLRAEAEHRSAGEDARPFFAILDEMNLARVEHYFSDFLSALESGEPLALHEDDAVESGEKAGAGPIPKRVRVPPNLYFTGTVNVDETTYMFSPKVLDRAFVLELNLVDLEGFGSTGVVGEQDVASLRLELFPGQLEGREPPQAEHWQQLGSYGGGELQRGVIDLHRLLEQHNRHFGYRVANEIGRFVGLAAVQADDSFETLSTALDLAVLLKVLPKLHGTQQELEPVLESLFAFATAGTLEAGLEPGAPFAAWQLDRDTLRPAEENAGAPPRLPRTAAKLFRMARRLQQQGFASFIE